MLWGLPRPTGDIDVVEVMPADTARALLLIGGEGSELARRYQLRFHVVGIAECPESYASRLLDITPRGFRHLRLLAFEAHDLALAKLGRNLPRDREDVAFLVSRGALRRETMQERFESELRPNLRNPERESLTLELWLDDLLPAAEV